MGLLNWFSAVLPSAAEIRAEIWKLGVRHHGEPLEGAMQELREQGATPARTVLLRACVQQLRKA